MHSVTHEYHIPSRVARSVLVALLIALCTAAASLAWQTKAPEEEVVRMDVRLQRAEELVHQQDSVLRRIDQRVTAMCYSTLPVPEQSICR